jgi:hypothetical protein
MYKIQPGTVIVSLYIPVSGEFPLSLTTILKIPDVSNSHLSDPTTFKQL